MAHKKIRCPKCGHEQIMARECESCGVIFSRYERVQKRREEARVAAEEAREKSGKRVRSVLQTLVLVVLTAAGTAYYLQQGSGPEPAPQPVESLKEVADVPKETAVPEPPPALQEESMAVVADKSPAQMGTMSLEEARQATVSIETPWGSGSGFFISDNFIITNRHVVQMAESVLVEYRRKVDMSRELVELEKKKIQDLRARLKRTNHGPTRNQLKIIIEESERNLQKFLPLLEEAESKLAELERKVQPGDIKIILADGSTSVANFLLISDRRDLALMSIYVDKIKYLRPPPQGAQLHQGDKVFTIGSPVGLRNTVTSGVFSGYRKDPEDGSLYLQTDAPINPGNSGGPLIDQQGYVHGVNTMIIEGTEGIGFAIPIETVFEEFGASIY